MKYLEKFEKWREYKPKAQLIDGHKIKILDGGPSEVSGGVQIDIITVMVKDEEYEFKIATLLTGDMFIYPLFSDGDFYEHFGLEENKAMGENELSEFLSCNDDSCIGEKIEIDDFEIEIIDFSHSGGVEEGYISARIDGEEYQFFILQDATGMGTEITIEFEDDEKAKENGIELTEELIDYLSEAYEMISSERR